MNVRKGMFRLWLVASVLFVIAVAVAYYGSIRNEFRMATTNYDAHAREHGGTTLLPVFCDKARGNSGTDYTEHQGLCWYPMEHFRRLYPEYSDLSDDLLAEKVYTKVGQPLNHIHPWHRVMEAAVVGFGVPLAGLVLGCSLLWAVAGFRGSHSRG